MYRQLFYVTNANASPNLLSRDGCYTLGVLKPCYSVETTDTSSGFQGKCQATQTQPTVNSDNTKMHVDLSHHCGNEGSAKEKPSHSNKLSLTKEQLQGMPLMKKDILEA